MLCDLALASGRCLPVLSVLWHLILLPLAALQKCARAPRTQCARPCDAGKFWSVAWIALSILLFVFPGTQASKRRPGAWPGRILQPEVGSIPAARSGAGMVWVEGTVLVFGGIADGGTFAQYFGGDLFGPHLPVLVLVFDSCRLCCAVYRNDLHLLVVDDQIWHNELKAGPEIPSPRSHFGFAGTSGSAYLFGGVGGMSATEPQNPYPFR